MGDLTENLSRSEFSCRCGNCKPIAVDAELVKVIQEIRDHCGQPITITSSYRCPVHNEREGGGTASKHLLGIAADIQVKGFPARDIAKYLRNTYPKQYGIGEYESFTHIDMREGPTRWKG